MPNPYNTTFDSLNESMTEAYDWPPMQRVNISKLVQGADARVTLPNRSGIEYSSGKGYGYGHNLDKGIETRQKKAQAWKKAVVELAKDGDVTKRTVVVYPRYGKGKLQRQRKATFYYVNNKFRLLVVLGKYGMVAPATGNEEQTLADNNLLLELPNR